MSRELNVLYNNAQDVIDENSFLVIHKSDPFAARLMLDQFVLFLEDIHFTDFERQMFLHTFLRNDYPCQVVDFVINRIINDGYEPEYTLVILEWKYSNRSYVFDKLSSLDAESLVLDQKQNDLYREYLSKQDVEEDKSNPMMIVFKIGKQIEGDSNE